MAEDFAYSKSPDKTYVEWKINNIFERCQKKDFVFNSPLFSICCSQWHLMAYIKPQSKLPLSGWLDLYLKKETYSKEHHVVCRIGIKKSGVEVKGFNFKCKSGSEENAWGMTDFIELEDFNPVKTAHSRVSVYSNGLFGMYSSDECFPKMSHSSPTFGSDGSLTVFCTASLQDDITLPPPISSTNGSKTFTDNIKDLYINKLYTDVSVVVKDKEFLAHKCILAARSAVFASMFDHDMVEKSSGRVEITDCDPDSFEEFLIFLYSGKLDVVSSSNAMSLYKTADKYNLQELMDECVLCLARELSVDSFCDVLHFATVNDKTDLLATARNFFNDNVKTILPNLKWQNFLEDNPSLCNELFLKFVDK